MKIILLIVVTFCCSFVYAQSNDDHVRTIDAKTVDFHDSANNVLGHIAIIEGLQSGLFIKSCQQTKDSAGFVLSEFKFCNPNHIRLFRITIILQFSDKVDSVYSFVEGLAKNVHTTFASNKSGTSYQTSELTPNSIINIKVVSKIAIKTYISGVDAQLH